MRVVLFSCIAALVVVGSASAAELSDKEFAEARKLYNAKCAKCHKFYDPAKYDDAEWATWMRKMSKKAKLKDAQADLIGRYLATYRKTNGTNTSAAAGAAK